MIDTLKNGLVFLGLALSTGAFAAASPDAPTPDKKTTVKYRQQGKMNFDSQVVEGDFRTDDLNIVTGESDEITDGLLKLRSDFTDHAALTAGQEVRP